MFWSIAADDDTMGALSGSTFIQIDGTALLRALRYNTSHGRRTYKLFSQ
jgi:hypothetical protein